MTGNPEVILGHNGQPGGNPLERPESRVFGKFLRLGSTVEQVTENPVFRAGRFDCRPLPSLVKTRFPKMDPRL
jgi:hypothetical protein